MLSQNEASTALQGHNGVTQRPKRTAALTLGAVGIVYGDIGTSPLYAFREALRPTAEEGVVILVLSFETSTALAAAYGIAVSGSMIVTTVLAYLMLHRVWGLPKVVAMVVLAPILLIEAAFLAANLAKVPDGGYLPNPN
ncbi:KUP/HAK/KT family potassium transporter [Pseudorhodobacter sp. W20_MBD10_FR17]|uniref:KUP/HAK/KT family potassium transporter n=1 Tax=Pseudorhodobacter sp. W20_MBD10_FR17 TaxID=3240266 RepID=UPI003F9CD2D5